MPEPFDAIARALALTGTAVLWTVLLVRIVGLRAFSKMTAFDFVTTIATGSLIAQAGTRSDLISFVQALAAIAGVFLIQGLLAMMREKVPGFQHLIQNQPLLLMENGSFLVEAMAESRVSRSNILEKLRAANVGDLSDVRAVVLETTGDISVLTKACSPQLLEGVERL